MNASRCFIIPSPSAAEIPPSLAKRVLLRDSYTCVYCCARNVPLEIDHVRPRAHFLSTALARVVNAPSNLVTACSDCNQAKGPQSPRGFVETLRGRELPAQVIAALLRRARASVRRELPFAIVP